jgi:hypothetical protein
MKSFILGESQQENYRTQCAEIWVVAHHPCHHEGTTGFDLWGLWGTCPFCPWALAELRNCEPQKEQ